MSQHQPSTGVYDGHNLQHADPEPKEGSAQAESDRKPAIIVLLDRRSVNKTRHKIPTNNHQLE